MFGVVDNTKLIKSLDTSSHQFLLGELDDSFYSKSVKMFNVFPDLDEKKREIY